MQRRSGKGIREIRQAQGLARRGLARAAVMNPARLHRVEHDRTRDPSVHDVAGLASCLSMSVDELLRLDTDEEAA